MARTEPFAFAPEAAAPRAVPEMAVNVTERADSENPHRHFPRLDNRREIGLSRGFKWHELSRAPAARFRGPSLPGVDIPTEGLLVLFWHPQNQATGSLRCATNPSASMPCGEADRT